ESVRGSPQAECLPHLGLLRLGAGKEQTLPPDLDCIVKGNPNRCPVHTLERPAPPRQSVIFGLRPRRPDVIHWLEIGVDMVRAIVPEVPSAEWRKRGCKRQPPDQ